MPKKTDLQIKMDLLKKLFDTGCVNEKQLQGLEMEDILLIPGITVNSKTRSGSRKTVLTSGSIPICQVCDLKNRIISLLLPMSY